MENFANSCHNIDSLTGQADLRCNYAKKFTIYILTCALALCFSFPVFAVSQNEFELSEQQQVIMEHFHSINEGNWSKWASYYAPSIRDSYESFSGNLTNQSQNIGILTVNRVNILNIEKVDNSVAYRLS